MILEFKNHYISFLNTPGKDNLIKNRLCGIVQCDYVLFVIDANDWEEKQMQLYVLMLIY
jgi:translation elongation factor EF-Tu-like GTPase